MATLTQERLRELLSYDQETGLFIWKMPASRRHPAPWSKVAGSPNNKGYIKIKIDGRTYAAHRLAWFWMTDTWPMDQIDHRDEVKNNNKWENLRDTTNSGNQANIIAARSTNRVGLRGAHYCTNGECWTSRIARDGKRHFLGYFPTAEEAHAAYRRAASELSGG